MVRKAPQPPLGGFSVFGVSYCLSCCLEFLPANLLTPKGGNMDGLGLLIVILFSTIIWWGTSSYYKAIIKSMDRARNLK